jgi:hypothetical protein
MNHLRIERGIFGGITVRRILDASQGPRKANAWKQPGKDPPALARTNFNESALILFSGADIPRPRLVIDIREVGYVASY